MRATSERERAIEMVSVSEQCPPNNNEFCIQMRLKMRCIVVLSKCRGRLLTIWKQWFANSIGVFDACHFSRHCFIVVVIRHGKLSTILIIAYFQSDRGVHFVFHRWNHTVSPPSQVQVHKCVRVYASQHRIVCNARMRSGRLFVIIELANAVLGGQSPRMHDDHLDDNRRQNKSHCGCRRMLGLQPKGLARASKVIHFLTRKRNCNFVFIFWLILCVGFLRNETSDWVILAEIIDLIWGHFLKIANICSFRSDRTV